MKIEKSYLKKEILYRCSYSGIKETDIMYDKLIIKRIDTFNYRDLALLKDIFIKYSDNEIYLILTKKKLPDKKYNNLFKKILF